MTFFSYQQYKIDCEKEVIVRDLAARGREAIRSGAVMKLHEVVTLLREMNATPVIEDLRLYALHDGPEAY